MNRVIRKNEIGFKNIHIQRQEVRHYLNLGVKMNYGTDFKSVKHEVSPEEWQARVELAACYRLIDVYGMTA